MPKADPLKGVRVYLISTDSKLTEEEFHDHYKHKIRKSNAEYPGCKYLVRNITQGDIYAQNFLRTAGISPDRITIYYTRKEPPPINIHNYKIKYVEPDQIFIELIMMSSHDIAWLRPDNPPESVSRIIEYRRKKLKDGKIIISQKRNNTS